MPRYINANELKQIIKEHDYVLRDTINSTDRGMFTIGIMQAIDEATSVDIPEDSAQAVEYKDCIERQNVIDLVLQNPGALPWELTELICSIPASDVYQVKHAMWLNEKGEYAPLDEYGRITDSSHCSHCGEWLEGSAEYRLTAIYCPCCGAKMDLKEVKR